MSDYKSQKQRERVRTHTQSPSSGRASSIRAAQVESKDITPKKNSLGNIGFFDSNEIQQPSSLSIVLCDVRYMFTDNDYSYKCNVCDRFRFLRKIEIETVSMRPYCTQISSRLIKSTCVRL